MTTLTVRQAYRLFKRLCKKMRVAPYTVCKVLGISYTTPYRWKTLAVKEIDLESNTKLVELARKWHVPH